MIKKSQNSSEAISCRRCLDQPRGKETLLSPHLGGILQHGEEPGLWNQKDWGHYQTPGKLVDIFELQVPLQ